MGQGISDRCRSAVANQDRQRGPPRRARAGPFRPVLAGPPEEVHRPHGHPADAGAGRTTRSTTDGATPRATGCSPRCWTPTRCRPPSWLRPTASGGRSTSPSTSSRPTNEDPAWCCACNRLWQQGHRPPRVSTQPGTPTARRTPRHQAQDAQVARQAPPPRRLAPTPAPTQLPEGF